MINILLFSLITNTMFYAYGHLINYDNSLNIFEKVINKSIIGAIVVSIVALFANFFLPLDRTFNTLILIIGFIILIFKKKKLKIDKKEILFILLISFVTSSLLLYSNVNRPDAGLYHLPYVSVLNEHKIIIGLSNIHFRFGHISIVQYLSAINNNHLLKDNGIVIPLASLASFLIIFFFNNVLNLIKENEKKISNFFSLFILIFISYKINRYSGFGNDALAHLLLFYLISYLLSNKDPDLKFIFLLSVFIFLNKSMLLLVFIFPLVIFIKNFKYENLKIAYSLPSFLLILWILKSLLISGCMIYPLKESCLKNLAWTDIEEVKYQSLSGEAWSKSWPDRDDKEISMQEFNKNFNWFNSWKKIHGQKIFVILIPYFLLIGFLMYLFCKGGNNKIKIYNKFYLYISLAVSIIGTILFFIKFPIFRYGYSFLVCSFILILITRIKSFSTHKINKISKIIFFICIMTLSTKQFLRYVENLDNNHKWPRIYSFNDNSKIQSKEVKLSKNFNVYTTKKVCMYSKSPCTNYKIKNNIKVLEKNNYIFINIKE